MRDRRAHMRWAAISTGLVAGMVVLSFAAVPAYRAFCQQFGFAGTPRISASNDAPTEISERVMTVRFNADTNGTLAWTFVANSLPMDVRLGETALAYYRASNDAARPVIGTATFNVTPLQAGRYFSKIQCFCFEEQQLDPGQSVDMPVLFYVDPSIRDDPDLKDLRQITLAYTFFNAND